MPKDAVNARIFYKILHLIETLIRTKCFAYNDFSFDFHILNETLKYYKLSISEYCNFVKKYKIYTKKKKLYDYILIKRKLVN